MPRRFPAVPIRPHKVNNCSLQGDLRITLPAMKVSITVGSTAAPVATLGIAAAADVSHPRDPFPFMLLLISTIVGYETTASNRSTVSYKSCDIGYHSRLK